MIQKRWKPLFELQREIVTRNRIHIFITLGKRYCNGFANSQLTKSYVGYKSRSIYEVQVIENLNTNQSIIGVTYEMVVGVTFITAFTEYIFSKKYK